MEFFVRERDRRFSTTQVDLAKASTPFKPICMSYASNDVSTFYIFRVRRVASPVKVISTRSRATLSICNVRLSTNCENVEAAISVDLRQFSKAFPPPAPASTMGLVFGSQAVCEFSFQVRNSSIGCVVLVYLSVFAFELVRISTCMQVREEGQGAYYISANVSTQFRCPNDGVNL